MELALSLGTTVAALEQEMTGVEFFLWQKYAAKRMLPWRRMELYLAQVCLKMAQVMGGNSEATLEDFLFDLPDDAAAASAAGGGTTEDAVEFFAFAPRNTKDKG